MEGTVEGVAIQLLVDTGASVNLISSSWWERSGVQKKLSPTNGGVFSVNGKPMNLTGEAEVTLGLGGRMLRTTVVVAEMGEEAILGAGVLRENHLMIDMARERLVWGVDAGRCRLANVRAVVVSGGHEALVEGQIMGAWSPEWEGLVEGCPGDAKQFLVGRGLVRPAGGSAYVRVLNPGREPVVIYRGTTLGELQKVEGLATPEARETFRCRVAAAGQGESAEERVLITELVAGTEEHRRRELATMLRRNVGAFQKNKEDKGHTDIAEHRIETGDTPPIKQAPRRLAPHRRQVIDEEVEKMMEAGVIEESNGPWASPVVLVKKKDGSTRFCVDYRRLNMATVKDAYPLPRVEDCLDTMAGASWFSSLDLASGYWQLDIAPEHREKTAFSTHRGLFQFRRMPFGLCNAPGTFERVMEVVMRGLQWKTCLVYLDDIVVFAASFEEHLERLEEVLQRLRTAGLKVKPSKCQLGRRRVGFLGHIVSQEGVGTDPAKVEAVRSWPAPASTTEVRSFLGLAGYYRAFVPDFSTVAKPLSALAEKGRVFHWSEECQEAFNELKRLLTASPILAFPHEQGRLVLDTDASDTGLGVVLAQEQGGTERVLAYGSRTLNKPERNYCVTRRELLAIVFGLRKFRHYLVGRPVLVRTDHASLRWLLDFKEPEGQLARWLQIITTYDLQIEHRPGKLHGNADGLSRRPCRQCGRNEEAALARCRILTRQQRVALEGAPPEAVGGAPEEGGREPVESVEWKKVQEEDGILAKVIRWYRGGEIPAAEKVDGEGYEVRAWVAQLDRLTMINDVLGRWWTAPGGRNHFQIAVPKDKREEILYQCHGAPLAGHLGRTRTVRRIQEAYYWPDYRRDATNWCARCEPCVRRKSAPPPHRAPMGHVATGLPLQRVAIDIMGPLPMSTRGNRFIMVVADYFTKWTEAYPLPNQTAGEVAKTFTEEFICRFGPPEVVHTDQGKNFQSQLFREVLALLEIRQTRTCAFRPQSDGMVERANRTIEMMLAATVAKDQRDWDARLPYVMAAYRSSVHASTGVSPNLMMLGRETATPMGLIYPREEPARDGTDYVAQMQQQMAEAYEYARAALGRSVERQRRNYDARACAGEIAIGATVYYYHPLKKQGITPKLQSYWTGPWKVYRRVGQAVYEIRMGRTSRMAHYDALKEAPPETGERVEEGGPGSPEEYPPPADPPDESEEEEEVVRRVRRITTPGRGTGGGRPPPPAGPTVMAGRPYREEVQKWLRERGIWLVGESLQKPRRSGVMAGGVRRQTGVVITSTGRGVRGPDAGRPRDAAVTERTDTLSPVADRAAPCAEGRETKPSAGIGCQERRGGPTRRETEDGEPFLLVMGRRAVVKEDKRVVVLSTTGEKKRGRPRAGEAAKAAEREKHQPPPGSGESSAAEKALGKKEKHHPPPEWPIPKKKAATPRGKGRKPKSPGSRKKGTPRRERRRSRSKGRGKSTTQHREKSTTQHRPSLASVVGAVGGKEGPREGGSPTQRQSRPRHRGRTPPRGKDKESHAPPARGHSKSRKRSPSSHGRSAPGGVHKRGAERGRQSERSHHSSKMGKDRAKEEYIGPDGEYLFVCDICKEAGKEKCWYTRRSSRDRHRATHSAMSRGYRCPGADCGHQVRVDRLADLRAHVATVHRGETVPPAWDQEESEMLRFDMEEAGPAQEPSQVGETTEKADVAPATPFSTAASVHSVLTTPGYEIGEESEADIAESVDFFQKLLGGTPGSIRRDLLGAGGEEPELGQLTPIEPFQALTQPADAPSTRGSAKRKAAPATTSYAKKRKQATPSSTAGPGISPGLAAATFHPDQLSPGQVRFVLKDLCRRYGKGEGDTPTRMLLNLARTRPDAVLDLNLMRTEYEKNPEPEEEISVTSTDKDETVLHSGLDLSAGSAPDNLLRPAGKGKRGKGRPKGRRSEEELSALSPVKTTGTDGAPDLTPEPLGVEEQPGTSTPAEVSMEELEGHEDLAARHKKAREQYEAICRETKLAVSRRAEESRQAAEKARLETLRLEEEAEEKRLAKEAEDKRLADEKAERDREAAVEAEKQREKDEGPSKGSQKETGEEDTESVQDMGSEKASETKEVDAGQQDTEEEDTDESRARRAWARNDQRRRAGLGDYSNVSADGEKAQVVVVRGEGVVLTSEAGEALLTVEVHPGERGQPVTTVITPNGVPTAVHGPDSLGPVVDTDRPRVTVLAVDRVPGADNPAPRPCRLMPWQQGYDGPDRLAAYSENLREPRGLGPQMVPTPGGSQSAAITPLPGGEIEITQVIRTRYAPVGRLGPCPTCGLVRVPTSARAATPEARATSPRRAPTPPQQ